MKKQAPRRRLPRKAGRGALVLVAGLLIASAIVRFASGPAVAIARETARPDASPQAPLARTGPQAGDFGAMLAEFQAREAVIAAREREIQDRMHALSIAERQIDAKLEALVEAENRLRLTLSIADTASEDDLARLTSVYENMKPKEAAKLFETMAADFSAGFLGRMRPDVAAGIMAGLSPEVAYSISVVLAGRNASVPTD